MKKIPILILTIVLFLLPTVFIYGQGFNYVPLSGITAPDGKELLGGSSTLPDAFGSLYKFGIGIVFTLAFLSFIYAGWQYVGSDVITQKSKGRERLEMTAIGLLIALSGFALLNTINPDILAFQNLDLSLKDPKENTFLDDLFRNNQPEACSHDYRILTTPGEITGSVFGRGSGLLEIKNVPKNWIAHNGYAINNNRYKEFLDVIFFTVSTKDKISRIISTVASLGLTLVTNSIMNSINGVAQYTYDNSDLIPQILSCRDHLTPIDGEPILCNLFLRTFLYDTYNYQLMGTKLYTASYKPSCPKLNVE